MASGGDRLFVARLCVCLNLPGAAAAPLERGQPARGRVGVARPVRGVRDLGRWRWRGAHDLPLAARSLCACGRRVCTLHRRRVGGAVGSHPGNGAAGLVGALGYGAAVRRVDPVDVARRTRRRAGAGRAARGPPAATMARAVSWRDLPAGIAARACAAHRLGWPLLSPDPTPAVHRAGAHRAGDRHAAPVLSQPGRDVVPGGHAAARGRGCQADTFWLYAAFGWPGIRARPAPRRRGTWLVGCRGLCVDTDGAGPGRLGLQRLGARLLPGIGAVCLCQLVSRGGSALGPLVGGVLRPGDGRQIHGLGLPAGRRAVDDLAPGARRTSHGKSGGAVWAS